MEMDPLKMHFLLKMGRFHCYVSLPEGKSTDFDGVQVHCHTAVPKPIRTFEEAFKLSTYIIYQTSNTDSDPED